MMEDLQLAGYSPKTQKSYLDSVRALAKYYMRSPDQLSEQEVRRFFLYLINRRMAAKSTVTIHLCGIKFFYEKTLGRVWPVFDLVRPRRSKKLPVVLSREEVRAVLKLLKHPVVHMALTVMYACGLRITEAARLKAKDIDADRKQLWVRFGKGGKDLAVPLPDHVRGLLRTHYKRSTGVPGVLSAVERKENEKTDSLFAADNIIRFACYAELGWRRTTVAGFSTRRKRH
jgi:integrase